MNNPTKTQRKLLLGLLRRYDTLLDEYFVGDPEENQEKNERDLSKVEAALSKLLDEIHPPDQPVTGTQEELLPS